MTITFVALAAAATGNNASVAPAAPAGLAVGDFVVIAAAIRNSGTGTVNTPTGWVKLADSGNASLLGRRWLSGDTMPTVTFAGGVANADTVARAYAFRGVSPDQTVPDSSAVQLNGSAQNMAYPALTVPSAGSAVVLFGWKQRDATSIGTPGGWTALYTTSQVVGDDQLTTSFYQIQTTATNISSGSLTVTGGAVAISRGLLIALKPAATFAVTLQDEYPPRALLSLTGLTLGDSVALYRVVAGERTAVRAGATDAVTDTSFLRVDAEMPFGVSVSYVAVVNDLAEYTSSAVTYSLPGGRVVLSDAITGAAAEVVILSWPEKAYETNATVYRVGSRNAVVSGPVGQSTSTIEVFVDSTVAATSLDTLLRAATSAIIQIRQPGGYDDVDGYLAVTAFRKRRWSQDGSDERRTYALDVAEVNGWAAELEARGYTLQDLADLYASLTLASLAADYASLLLLAQADLQP